MKYINAKSQLFLVEKLLFSCLSYQNFYKKKIIMTTIHYYLTIVIRIICWRLEIMYICIHPRFLYAQNAQYIMESQQIPVG